MDIINDLNNYNNNVEQQINIKINENENENNNNNNNINYLNIPIIANIIEYSNYILQYLGLGFIEGIYHKALLVDLYKTKYSIQTKQILPIYYNDVNIGYVEPDIIVEDENYYIIIELKAIDKIGKKEELQIKKYINHSNTKKIIIGVIVNFNQNHSNFENKIIEYKIIC